MKKSAFDIQHQNNHIESKIVVALERISQAFRVLLWEESKDNSLSPIQIQILIFLLYHSPEQSKVSYLANEFNMTKATVSDSVKVLLQKELVIKTIDESDTRSYSISLTPEGKKIAQKSASFAGVIEKPLHQLPEKHKEILLNSLLELIEKLNKAGVISVQRMCISCSFYKKTDGVHYCHLIKNTLAVNELKTDCPDHEVKV